MTHRILLYGATGYSGRLIVEEALRRLSMPGGGDFTLVLGGRDRRALEELSQDTGFDYVTFALDDQPTVNAIVDQFDVLLNAAGPFAATGMRLAKSAIATGCHYVDINGEIDVYQKMDDLGRSAEQRDVTMVSGAGFTAAVSDVLLDWAIAHLKMVGLKDDRLGDVRIAVAAMTDLSRGSVLTMLRSVREEVLTIRRDQYAHVPIGRIERSFDFEPARNDPDGTPSEPRIASAVNVLDSITALRTFLRYGIKSNTIVSFAEMSRAVRAGYQAGALSTIVLQLPGVQQLTRLQLSQLPDGPDEEERKKRREIVLLQIDSPFAEPWIDWRLETPSSYDVTAILALATARAVAALGNALPGWRTPAEVLRLTPPPRLSAGGASSQYVGHIKLGDPFEDCTLECRRVLAVS